MKNSLLPYFIIFIVFVSCNSGVDYSDQLELDSLKTENAQLKARVDSLSRLFINEKAHPVLFNRSHGDVLKVGDSAEFLVGVLYNRPQFCDSIVFSVFTHEDSLDSAIYNMLDYDFMYRISMQSQNELVTGVDIKVPYLSDKYCALGGFIRVNKSEGLEMIPIKYVLTE